jgi:hypothetical protein
MNTYMIYRYEPDSKEHIEDLRVVKDGFNLWAFVFTIIWLLAYRLWRPALAFVLFIFAIEFLVNSEVIGDSLGFVIKVIASWFVGVMFHQFLQSRYESEGYKLCGIVYAKSSEGAKMLYLRGYV